MKLNTLIRLQSRRPVRRTCALMGTMLLMLLVWRITLLLVPAARWAQSNVMMWWFFIAAFSYLNPAVEQTAYLGIQNGASRRTVFLSFMGTDVIVAAMGTIFFVVWREILHIMGATSVPMLTLLGYHGQWTVMTTLINSVVEGTLILIALLLATVYEGTATYLKSRPYVLVGAIIGLLALYVGIMAWFIRIAANDTFLTNREPVWRTLQRITNGAWGTMLPPKQASAWLLTCLLLLVALGLSTIGLRVVRRLETGAPANGLR